jgi:DNA invertase Pin-like site-specific DNA recombinase
MQEASVNRMAQAFEDATPELFVDWGISGARKDRPEYLRLKDAIAAERISTVYCYSLNRLGRNARELLDFFDLCKGHGTKVASQAEGGLSNDTSMGTFLLTVLSALAELEREMARERILSAIAAKQERGDAMGQPPIGHRHEWDGERIVRVRDEDDATVLAVLNAYVAADRSAFTAADLLNAAGVASARGKRWYQSSVGRVVATCVPQLERAPERRAPYRKATMTLSGLLRCHCGHTMTPNATRGQFYCSRGHSGRHDGRWSATEAMLLPWVAAEAARLIRPDAVVTGPPDERRAEVEAEVARMLEQNRKGWLTDAQADALMEGYQAELAGLASGDVVHELPSAIEFDTDAPEAVNGVLRALWTHVELDAEMRPVRAEWRVPQWRAA